MQHPTRIVLDVLTNTVYSADAEGVPFDSKRAQEFAAKANANIKPEILAEYGGEVYYVMKLTVEAAPVRVG